MQTAEEYLAARGVEGDVAEAAGLFYVPDARAVYPDFKHVPAIVIPYLDPTSGEPMTFMRDGEERAFCRVRYLANVIRRDGKALRFHQPGGSGLHAYFPPLVDWTTLMADAREPLVVTEGEIKALACTAAGIPTIGLGGVYNFGKGGLLPELESIVWRERDVYVCYDSDAAYNPNVAAAEARLVAELQTARGARCRLVRIPTADESTKVGLDDFLKLYGVEHLVRLLKETPDLHALDAKVIALNDKVAWIANEEKVFDIESKSLVTVNAFVSGSEFSTLKHFAPAAKGKGVTQISIARTWLTHPHAQRYSEMLFRPGQGPVVETQQGKLAINMWTGWDSRPGDVAPFQELTDYLFQRMEPEEKDFAIKLLAYKVQNPMVKVPLALVLIGPQGSGKSLWADCVREAFGRYGATVSSASLTANFQDWLETAVFAIVDEAESEHMARGGDALKSLISDVNRPMNVKYRKVRQIESYTMYCITSNDRAVGSFANDDRRMVVIDCPPGREQAFYDRLWAWRAAGGPKALMWWLQEYDLAGWKPPQRAPATAEKRMAYREGLSPVFALAEEMRTSDENTVKQWLDAAVAWANIQIQGTGSTVAQARAVLDSAPVWQIRPWYSADELARMFPYLMTQTTGKARVDITPGELSRQLRNAGIPYLRPRDDASGFHWRGKLCTFLVVSDFDEWENPLSQEDFERYMNGWPRYGDLAARRAAR